MDPANLRARLAPRAPWQAVDLGTRFYRHWWRQASLIWLTFTAVPYLLLATVASVTQQFWPLLMFWWLKPLWERPLLAFFSHALFDDYPGPGTLLRRFRSYALNGLAGQLLWYRLGPSRGYLAGVWQLEGLRGDRALQRAATLKRSPGQRAISLTAITATLEQCLGIALIVLLVTLIPWRFSLEMSAWLTAQSSLHWAVSALAWYLAMTITEPLYVATSFSMYLNERTRLEGWDLQVGLARIGERRRASGLLPLALLAAVAIGSLTVPGRPALAAETPSAKQQAVQVLASPQFMPMEWHTERRLKPSLAGDNDEWLQWLAELLASSRHGDAGAPTSWPDWLDEAALAALVTALGWVLFRLLRGRNLPSLLPRRPASPAPVVVAGLDTRPEALPKDLTAAVHEALNADRSRQALALLLRDALVMLFQHHPLTLPPGVTEQECLRAYQAHLGQAAAVRHLQAVVAAWTATAWAHRTTRDADILTLLEQRPQGRTGEVPA